MMKCSGVSMAPVKAPTGAKPCAGKMRTTISLRMIFRASSSASFEFIFQVLRRLGFAVKLSELVFAALQQEQEESLWRNCWQEAGASMQTSEFVRADPGSGSLSARNSD